MHLSSTIPLVCLSGVLAGLGFKLHFDGLKKYPQLKEIAMVVTIAGSVLAMIGALAAKNPEIFRQHPYETCLIIAPFAATFFGGFVGYPIVESVSSYFARGTAPIRNQHRRYEEV